MSTTEHAQTYEFKAEIKQLLDILIHSVYSAKDTFIRELISNATDALEKVRFRQVEGTALHSPELPLEIRIETKSDDAAKLLVISDTGIGMTEEEVRENIGTIAHSGTSAFLAQLKAQSAATEKQSEGMEKSPALSLIGRFGVGFYSVFMAADQVTLITRSADPTAKAVRWTSDGTGGYTIETLDEELPRGTRIEIKLKEGETRFADAAIVKSTIQRYSNFVPFPIFVDGDRVNQTTALWREPSSQVTDEQYNEFYKLVGHDFQEPLLHLHFSVDAPLQFAALLYTPQTNPEAMGFGESDVKLSLYVRRVLIDGENHDLLPKYLRFVRGVVESEDLPLNVSRETLQENRMIVKIREQLTRRLLEQFLELAKEDAAKYETFWRAFQRILKEGYSDYANREKFQDLLRFNSSRHSDGQGLISLAEYVEKMPEQQQAIYYLSGASREALLRDPRLELFRKKQLEVLYLTDLADEFVLDSLREYKGKQFVSADQAKPEDVQDLGTKDEEKPQEAPPAEVVPLIVRFKELLGDRVIDVRASERLVDSPACLVADADQMSGHMDRMFRMMNKDAALPQRILEINPQHALIRNLARLLASDPLDPLVATACEQLFEGSMLVDGYLADPHRLVERMNQVLADAASLKAGSAQETLSPEKKTPAKRKKKSEAE